MKKGDKVKTTWDSTCGVYTIDYFMGIGSLNKYNTAKEASQKTGTSIDQVVVFFTDRNDAVLYHQCMPVK